jgi:hypothetical protein
VQVRHQQAEATKPVIAAEDVPDAFGFSFVDGNLPVLGLIAERAMPPTQRPLRFEAATLSLIRSEVKARGTRIGHEQFF